MANILAILPGLSLAELSAMTVGELMRWHEMAVKRNGADK